MGKRRRGSERSKCARAGLCLCGIAGRTSLQPDRRLSHTPPTSSCTPRSAPRIERGPHISTTSTLVHIFPLRRVCHLSRHPSQVLASAPQENNCQRPPYQTSHLFGQNKRLLKYPRHLPRKGSARASPHQRSVLPSLACPGDGLFKRQQQ